MMFYESPEILESVFLNNFVYGYIDVHISKHTFQTYGNKSPITVQIKFS